MHICIHIQAACILYGHTHLLVYEVEKLSVCLTTLQYLNRVCMVSNRIAQNKINTVSFGTMEYIFTNLNTLNKSAQMHRWKLKVINWICSFNLAM